MVERDQAERDTTIIYIRTATKYRVVHTAMQRMAAESPKFYHPKSLEK